MPDMPRTTREVLEDRLRLRKPGATVDDIAHNYADDLIVLTGTGGISGAAVFARLRAS
ncbi:MAG TPA: hypothetical protein VGR22_06635 [Thermomicrobiales bacterium]|nr:hypothetical protein [Thermomicrobiales bacterium]